MALFGVTAAPFADFVAAGAEVNDIETTSGVCMGVTLHVATRSPGRETRNKYRSSRPILSTFASLRRHSLLDPMPADRIIHVHARI